jgi:uncharacterized SAM-binding protein YcdF (DUF218 family)
MRDVTIPLGAGTGALAAGFAHVLAGTRDAITFMIIGVALFCVVLWRAGRVWFWIERRRPRGARTSAAPKETA